MTKARGRGFRWSAMVCQQSLPTFIACALLASAGLKCIAGHNAAHRISKVVFWSVVVWELGIAMGLMLTVSRRVALGALAISCGVGIVINLAFPPMGHCGCLGDIVLGYRARIVILAAGGLAGCWALSGYRNRGNLIYG